MVTYPQGDEAFNSGDYLVALAFFKIALSTRERFEVQRGAAGQGLMLAFYRHRIARTLHALGELKEAEHHFKVALDALSHPDGGSSNASETREKLAQLYEAMLEPESAAILRVQGGKRREMRCANHTVNFCRTVTLIAAL